MCQRNQPLRVSSDRQSGRAAWVRSGFVGPARGALDVGGAFPGGVEGGVVLEEEAEDDVELANGADSFAEAGFHAGGAADLSVEAIGPAGGGGFEVFDEGLEPEIEIGRHAALDER